MVRPFGWAPNGAPGAGLALNVRAICCFTVSMLVTESSSVFATSTVGPTASRALGSSPTAKVFTWVPEPRSTSETVPVVGAALWSVTIGVP